MHITSITIYQILFQNGISWKKNLRPSEDLLAYGIDLTSNFGYQWASCKKTTSMFAMNYPGTAPFSENETKFIKDVLLKHKDKTKAYVSIRMNGHSLLYPFSYARVNLENDILIKKYAYEITNRVNLRAGTIQLFTNESIFSMNGKPRCGSSVDYAYDLGIPYCFEMRVFFGRASGIMAQFQALPRGYHSQLLMGYLSGLKKLYDLILTEVHHKGKMLPIF